MMRTAWPMGAAGTRLRSDRMNTVSDGSQGICPLYSVAGGGAAGVRFRGDRMNTVSDGSQGVCPLCPDCCVFGTCQSSR